MSAAQTPPSIDYARFRHCFPDLGDMSPETIIEAYEEITALSPAIVLAPEFLRRLIAARVRGRQPLPYLGDVSAEAIIEAYEEITEARPSLVRAPEILCRLIAAMVRARLPGPIPRPSTRTSEIAARVRRFLDDLGRMLEGLAEHGLISDEAAVKIQRLVEEFEVDNRS